MRLRHRRLEVSVAQLVVDLLVFVPDPDFEVSASRRGQRQHVVNSYEPKGYLLVLQAPVVNSQRLGVTFESRTARLGMNHELRRLGLLRDLK
jgi:hypothetical protein